MKIQTAADAERLAAKGEAVWRDQRSRRSSSSSLPEVASDPDPEIFEEPSDSEPLDEEKEELLAALGNLNPPRRNSNSSSNPPERRRATSATRCYGCGQYGHFKSDCPRPNRQGLRRFSPRAKLECLRYKGNHFVRNYPSLPAANKRLSAQDKPEKRSPRSKVQPPRLVHRRPMSLVLRSSATKRQY